MTDNDPNEQPQDDVNPMTGARVLVVDDVHLMRRSLSKILESAGVVASTAENGEKALMALQSAEINGEPFDLVLLDLMMPVMDGTTLLGMVREDPKLKDTKVIAITARGDRKTVSNIARLGVSGYIIKPYKIAKVLQTVEEVLAKSIAPDGPEGEAEPS